MKSYQNQQLISKISNNEETYVGQEEVTKGITSFYRNLYARKEQEVIKEDDNFYKYCPKLTSEQNKRLENDLTINDLFKALMTCKDSSPGPDGIPYSIYKKILEISRFNYSGSLGI